MKPPKTITNASLMAKPAVEGEKVICLECKTVQDPYRQFCIKCKADLHYSGKNYQHYLEEGKKARHEEKYHRMCERKKKK